MNDDSNQDDPRGISRMSGGVLRFDAMAPTLAEEVSVAPSHRVNSGTVRYTIGDAEAGSSGFARFQHGAEGPPQEVASIANTLSRMPNGQEVVWLPGGMQTSAKAAEQMGLLRRDGDRWVDVENAAGQLAASNTEASQGTQQEDPGAGVFDAEEDQLWAEDIADVPQHSYDAAVSSAMASLTSDVSLERTAKQLSESAGIDPALAQDYVAEGMAMYQRAADKAVAPLLGTPERVEAFYSHLRGSPMQLQEAVQAFVYMRDPSKLQDLAKTWRRSNQPDVSAWHAAGFETAADTDGAVLIRKGTGNWVRAEDMR